MPCQSAYASILSNVKVEKHVCCRRGIQINTFAHTLSFVVNLLKSLPKTWIISIKQLFYLP